jgi:hypothetical protein
MESKANQDISEPISAISEVLYPYPSLGKLLKPSKSCIQQAKSSQNSSKIIKILGKS